jgi:transcription antitermination factor NusG
MRDVAGDLTSVGDEGWLVVWTESRAERKVQSRIAAMGADAWLPTVTERHRWSDRWRDVVTPLFPGYLFVRRTPVSWHQLLRTPGVLTVVKEAGRPALLSDGFVASLRQAIEGAGVAAERLAERTEYNPGDEVIVQEGSLAGVRGVVRDRRSGRQLVIWVREIGRGVAFTIGAALVSPGSAVGRTAP